MQIRVKMLGDLRQYLPAGSAFNRCQLEVAEAVLGSVLRQLAVPADKPYLVSVNNTLIHQPDYATLVLQADDEVTLIPPIKGG